LRGPARGVLAVAAGLLRHDQMELAGRPVSWHSETHTIVSWALYADLGPSAARLAAL